MAVTLVASTGFNGPTSQPDGNTDRLSFTLTNASGNDRLVVVIPVRVNGVPRSVSSTTFNATAGTVWQNVNDDGGNACCTGVLYFDETELPASAGSYDIDVVWSGGGLRYSFIVAEFSGADQANPLENFGSGTLTNTVEGPATTISSTLSGSSGKFAVSFLAAGELSASLDEESVTQPAGMTVLNSANQFGDVPVTAAYLASAASSSEVYQWVADYNDGGRDVDAYVTGSFAINETPPPGVNIDVPSGSIALTTYAPSFSTGASAPVISSVSDLNAEETVTVTVDQYQAGAEIYFNGVAQTTVEATATTLTCVMPRGGFGGIGASINATVVDSNGTSNTVVKTYLSPIGFSAVTLTSVGSGSTAEAIGAAISDIFVYEDTDDNANAFFFDAAGYANFSESSPGGAVAEFYVQDASDGYSAPAAPNSTVTKVPSLDIPAASLGVTTYAPTVVVGGATIIDVPPSSLSFATFAPTISTGSSAINVPPSALSITTYAPTVFAGSAIVIDVPSSNLNLATYAPIIRVSEVSRIKVGAISLMGTLVGAISNI